MEKRVKYDYEFKLRCVNKVLKKTFQFIQLPRKIISMNQLSEYGLSFIRIMEQKVFYLEKSKITAQLLSKMYCEKLRRSLYL
jgi:hypothetical protein